MDHPDWSRRFNGAIDEERSARGHRGRDASLGSDIRGSVARGRTGGAPSTACRGGGAQRRVTGGSGTVRAAVFGGTERRSHLRHRPGGGEIAVTCTSIHRSICCAAAACPRRASRWRCDLRAYPLGLRLFVAAPENSDAPARSATGGMQMQGKEALFQLSSGPDTVYSYI